MTEVKLGIASNLAAAEKLELFLKKIKKSQEEKNLSLYFTSLCQELRSDFTIIPSQSKKPVTKFQTDEDKKKANLKKIGTSALLLIPDWLAVVDIDDVTLFCEKLNTNINEIEKIANVKTGKGYHIYIYDTTKSIKSANCVKEYGFEILRNENDVVMLPGSRIYHEKLQKNVCYEVLNSEILTIENITIYTFIKNAITISQNEQNGGNGNGKEKRKETTHRKINIERLKKIILKKYEEGHRQDVIMYMSGWLRKEGISKNTVEKIVTDICFESGDREVKMRLAAVEQAWKKEPEQLKGLTGLIELGYSEQELKSCLQKEKTIQPQPIGWGFFSDGTFVYLGREIKDNTVYEMLGPYFSIISKIHDNSNIMYEIKHGNDTAIMKEIKDLETIRKVTGKAIINEKKVSRVAKLRNK